MKNIRKKIIIPILIIFCLCFISKGILAVDTDYFNPGKLTYSESKGFFEKVAPIINVLSNIGIIGSVLAIAIIGLKTMLASDAEQKFKFKEMLFPVICGCLMIVGVFSLLKIIAAITNTYIEEQKTPIYDSETWHDEVW